MPQTRRRRWKRSSGDSSRPPQEQMTGGSSSHAAQPRAPSCVYWDDDIDDFMPPKSWPRTPDVPPPVHEPGLEKRERERQEVRQVMLHHLKHQLVLTRMTIWMTSCPPNHGLQHMMFLPLHLNLDPEKERKGKGRGSSSYAAAPQAPTCVNWDDDMDDFIPPNLQKWTTKNR